ncbi:hypothetical protein MVEN_02500500 [Mycena venus]|uniref:DUF6534 domain-containing protein n=1 Tax=Mycena venus TaxID=2733690 RepID=A0A8H6WUG4_9AGAR|nr:hypothetical protein MVEN_02500500 [Mycena venus]
MPEVLDGIPLTIGALVCGAMVSIGLSAVVGFQTFLYFQLFPMDTLLYKTLVAWIWITDAGHTIAVCATVWEYVVLNFDNPAKLLEIAPGYPIHIILTVIATMNANLFYTWRIHRMSKQNWWISGPICMLCLTRTGPGGIIHGLRNASLLISKKWDIVAANFKVVEICGWAVSGITDIVISTTRYYYLRDLKQGYMTTREMVDAVVIFTINDGLSTCAVVITVIICFMTMENNFIYIAVFFVLAKLFANSLLTTLNLRNWYRHRHRPMGISINRHHPARNTIQMAPPADKSMQSSDMTDMPATMEVFVDQQVEYNVPVGKYNENSGDPHSQP